jgi:carboxypeptidase family protein/TonB-dependent receptor-like protein
MPKWFLRSGGLIALAAMLLVASPALAQFGQSTGGIHGRVTDEQGGVLPGVTVTIKGPGAPQTLFTDSRGEFHAINLSPGKYTITLALQGFTTVNRENVNVEVGRDAEIPVQMKLSSVAATVTVSGEPPVIETRKVQTGAQVTNEELKGIPTSRDPWVVLQTIPGVQIDRVNVAGSESGQQSNFSSKGSTGGTFQVDGVNLTDMSALGASAGYYDFDSFQEMQVITGGSDPSVQGSGAHLNMITKRGTNDVHGSARIFAVDHHFQSTNLPSEAADQAARGFPLASGNHIDSVQDYGAEAGGAVWRDHLWLWGSYGRDQINLVTAGGAQDKTTLEDFNVKANAQIVPSNSIEVWYLRSDKIKFGRNAGPTHPQETTWDQVLPQNTWKVQDSQVFSSSLFASAQYSGQNGNFVLSPEGGLSRQAFIDGDGVWHNSYEFYSAPRPQRQVRTDASFFFNTGSLGHELKAGFNYLKAGVTSTSIWPGDGSGGLASQTYGDLFDCAIPCATITRNGTFSVSAKYYGVFLGDTITAGNLTLNLGVRYDKQSGSNLASSVPANASFPTIMPALNYGGADGGFTWKDYQPRVGLTYALGAARTTIFKASYSRYAEALGTAIIAQTNPVAGAAYAYYAWNDANHNNLVEPGEVDTSAAGFQFGRNYNDACPGCVSTPPGGIDRNLKAPNTDEFIVGVDHELLPAFAVGVAYTYRKFNDLLNTSGGTFAGSWSHIYDPATGRVLTSNDYEQYTVASGVLPDGTAFSSPVYQIKPSVLDALGGTPAGSFILNRPNFYETYNGVELTLNKRLADKWMVRGNFVYNINKQHNGAGSCIDPTNQLVNSTVNAQTCRDDDYVGSMSTGSGSKTSVFLNSKWQFNVVGLYQLPLGFNVAANFYGRQGYPINYYTRVGGASDGLSRNVVVVAADDFRYKNVYELDLRAEKVIPIVANATLTLSLDCFNITNENTVLQRQNRLGLASTNTIREIQSPRIFRFGARVAF